LSIVSGCVGYVFALPVGPIQGWQKCDDENYSGNLISRGRDNAVADSRQISPHQLAENFELSTYPISRLPPRPARLLFDLVPKRKRSVASPRIAVRRMTIHLLARIAVAATCTSSAAALDATHISRMTGVIANRSHSLVHRWHEGRPNHRQYSKSQPASHVDWKAMTNLIERTLRGQSNQLGDRVSRPGRSVTSKRASVRRSSIGFINSPGDSR